ncbi:class I SAM-dependent DNA methyltransferase [Loktanella agnita]|uniref:class I SAM-dependent DNA methyltransferase n=1 Tax=Loktanella agnita TaxID=287097 RepID=UPI0039876C43
MADKKDKLRPELWAKRSIADTIALYAEWADRYEADVTARGYHTPARVTAAVKDHVKPNATILDFGCGTGFAGQVLHDADFQNLHGTDVSPEMLEKASARGVYAKTWLSNPGKLSFGRGAYPVIVAVGVIGLGAAPADTLGALVGKLNTGDLLAFSYNDPTLEDPAYTDALSTELGSGQAEIIFREHGPHLTDVGMGADVIILRRR